MTDYKMTDEKRKKLTEKLLGECWHDYVINGNKLSKCSCGMTGCNVREVCAKENRIFTSDADMLAVFRKIEGNGLWDFYMLFVDKVYRESKSYVGLTAWLFLDNPERACCLAADFWEEQGT